MIDTLPHPEPVVVAVGGQMWPGTLCGWVRRRGERRAYVRVTMPAPDGRYLSHWLTVANDELHTMFASHHGH